MAITQVGKREFIQHASKYLKLSESHELIITHHNQPKLRLSPIKVKTIHDLQGLLTRVEIHGDINEHVLPGYDQW